MSDEAVQDSQIDYAQWGALFFETAVTEERVLAGVNAIAGQPIDVGPLGVGPGRVAKVTATGEIGTASGERISSNPVAFAVRLPVSLQFNLDLGLDVQRFDADIVVPLRLTAHARDDLAIVIDIAAPQASEVQVLLKAQGLRASITQIAAGVEGELQRFVAKYVAREVSKPKIQEARVIDVGAAVNKAAGGVVPEATSSREVAADVSTALADEIRDSDGLFLPSQSRKRSRE